jgi:predicted NBD/HSP70 family sugar kinase
MTQPATSSLIRSINRSAVLDLLQQESPQARATLARRLGMSLPTVMRIVDELIAEDLLRVGRSESTGGRPGALIELNGAGYAVIGVDLGGSKMFGAVTDLSGNLSHETYLPHDGQGAENCLDRLCDLIQKLIEAPRPPGQRLRGIGIGAPGITRSPEGIVLWSPQLNWRDLPLKDILTDRFKLPVFVENDVNLAALGEWGFGAGKGARSLVLLAVGTGIGAGIVLDGAVYHGAHQAAGEVGYLLPGPDFLGRRYDGFGAFEGIASGLGIAARRTLRHGRRTGAWPSDSRELCLSKPGAAWRAAWWMRHWTILLLPSPISPPCSIRRSSSWAAAFRPPPTSW